MIWTGWRARTRALRSLALRATFGAACLGALAVQAPATVAGPASGREPALAISRDGQTASQDALEGTWEARTYSLATGESHDVRGRILFAERHWQVLFFVLDGSGEPRRGSAEGGTYTFDGEELVFRHDANLTYGTDLPGLPATGPTMTVRPPRDAVAEPVRALLDGRRLTLQFPSGNVLEFVRAS